MSGPAGHGTSAVVLGGRRIELEDLCPTTRAKLTGTQRRTRLAARWQVCPGLDNGVRLRAHLDGCNRLSGSLRVRQPAMRVPLVAADRLVFRCTAAD